MVVIRKHKLSRSRYPALQSGYEKTLQSRGNGRDIIISLIRQKREMILHTVTEKNQDIGSQIITKTMSNLS